MFNRPKGRAQNHKLPLCCCSLYVCSCSLVARPHACRATHFFLFFMPDNAKPAQDLADFLADTGHEEGAAHWLQECIKRDMRNAHCPMKLGLLHIRAGRYAAAISLLERSAALQPSRQTFNGLGVAYFHTKQAHLALLAYANAVAADDGIIANTVAVLVNAAGAVLSHDAALAVRAYAAAVRCKRAHAQAQFGLGRALLWLTPPRAKAAVLHLGHSIRLDPSLTQVSRPFP